MYNDALEKFNRYDKRGTNPDNHLTFQVKTILFILRIERLDY